MANRWSNLVCADHKFLFIEMKLVGCDTTGDLVLTELAWRRLEDEVRKSWVAAAGRMAAVTAAGRTAAGFPRHLAQGRPATSSSVGVGQAD
jgi:hypothetical protein